MKNPRVVRLAAGVLLVAAYAFPQSEPAALVDAARQWLKSMSSGSSGELNGSMDELFFATTPVGDVLTKERLVPSDPNLPVQQLPPMELDGPLARVFGQTGVVMSRLKPATGPSLNATFVFVKQPSAWKLVALHLAPGGQ